MDNVGNNDNLNRNIILASLMIHYQCLAFEQLSIDQLYAILRLRQEVFVVEQSCAYLDADGRDALSWHIFGTDEQGHLVAYARICPPGVSYEKYVSIGRVIVAERVRGIQEGYKLMRFALAQCQLLYPGTMNKISAQAHLQGYYGNLGYQKIGEAYLEDGIPHIAMIRVPN